MKKVDIVVLGSINLDIMVNVSSFPKYGDTVTAKSIQMLPGGKGSNQAVAVAKQGSSLIFLGAVGSDGAGKQMLNNLQENGIDTEFIYVDSKIGTGTFVPIVDDGGENTMVGTLGANASLSEEYINNIMDQVEAKVLLLQMETSEESVMAALKKAKEKGMYVILDPAPADGFRPAALRYADVITPNQQETERITGVKVTDVDSALEAAKVLESMGTKNSIIKLGADGNVIYQSGKVEFVPSLKVKAVNTVGAGDTFAGALASEYARTGDLVQAVKYGNVTAGLKVSRGSGQVSIPTRAEVENYMRNQ
ncbi:MAG: ribokinase [Selenomonadaceae bacterium]|nr:ribokinase [Selenomonadaceae bacterium]